MFGGCDYNTPNGNKQYVNKSFVPKHSAKAFSLPGLFKHSREDNRKEKHYQGKHVKINKY